MINTKKRQIFNKIWDIKEEHEKLDERLESLYQEGKITGGARFYVNDSHSNAGIKLFRKDVFWPKTGYEKNTKIKLRTLYKMAQEDYNKALAFVEEQEAADKEISQLERLRKAGQLR